MATHPLFAFPRQDAYRVTPFEADLPSENKNLNNADHRAAHRVAFVYLHAQAGGDYFSDEPFCWTAGELRALGVQAEVFHVHFDREQPLTTPDLSAQLLEILRNEHFGLVVLDQCWLPELIRAMQKQGTQVVATDAFGLFGDAQPDFTLAHFAGNRLPLLDLVQTWLAQGDFAQVPNLRWLEDGEIRVATVKEMPLPPTPIARRPYVPVTDVRVLGTPRDLDGRTPPLRKSIDINSGCPFSAPIAKNPLLQTVVPDEATEVTRAGCSFCFMGGDYRALPVAETVQLTVEHIAILQQKLPELQEIVLRDQSSLRYLPHLIAGMRAKNLHGLGILLPGRGDAILRYGKELREAAELCAGTDLWFAIHLIGFESFSQPQLDLYNKGVTVEEYAEALAQMRELHRLFPQAFRLDRGGASSFILFNPWTTLADLQANADFCHEHAVLELATGLHLTRLRLYPNLPLYWKAQQDGLLDAGPALQDRGAAFTGYTAEANWHFADARVALVENALRRLARHCELRETVGLLQATVQWVRAQFPQPLGTLPDVDLADLEQEFLQLRALWRPRQPRPEPQRPDPQRQEPGPPLPKQKENAAQQRTLLAGRTCNNHCQTCVSGHGQFPTDSQHLQTAIQQMARTEPRIVLAGREPLLLPEVLALLRAGKQAGAEQLVLVSNGRMLATTGVAGKVARAGATQLLLKRHRLADTAEDGFCQAPGAGQQMWQGARAVQETPGLRWLLLLVVTREGASELAEIVQQAKLYGARGVQVQVPLAQVNLAELTELHGQLERCRQQALQAEMTFAIEGF